MVIHTKLNRQDFQKILEAYSITGYISHKHIPDALDNTVYFVKTKKRKYILKILENLKKDYLDFQIDIISQLKENKIPVAKYYHLKNSKAVLVYNGKNLTLQEFVEGKNVDKYTDLLIKDVALKTGLLSKSLLKIKLNGKYHWDEHHFKSKEFKEKIFGFDYAKEESNLLSEMKKINKNKLRRSFVHGDIHDNNILVKNNQLKAFIDWDDLHEDYLVFELAVLLIDPCLDKKGVQLNRIKLITSFYQKNMKLNFEEKKALYYFMKRRVLSTIFWLSKQIKIHPNLKSSLKKSIVNKIKKYNHLNKLKLEDFLKLID